MKKLEIDILAVDYGGVLAHHYCEPYQSELSKILGVDDVTTKKLLSEKSEHGKAYRLDKISKEEFWNKVKSLAQCKNNVDNDQLQLLWAKTYILDLRVYQLLQNIKEQTTIKICLYTNSDRLRMNYAIKIYGLESLFDVIFSSWENGVIKPEQSSFSKLKQLFDLTSKPERIFYIDDRVSTIEAAKNEGIYGYVYKDYESLSSFIYQNLPLKIY